MTLFEADVLLLMLVFCITNVSIRLGSMPRWYKPALTVSLVLALFVLFFTVLQGVRP